MNDPSVVDALIAALNDKNWADRGVAAGVLGHVVDPVPGVGDPRVMEALIAALKDEDAGVREGAAMALGVKGDNFQFGPLSDAMDAEQDPDVKSAMDEALHMIVHRRMAPINKVAPWARLGSLPTLVDALWSLAARASAPRLSWTAEAFDAKFGIADSVRASHKPSTPRN